METNVTELYSIIWMIGFVGCQGRWCSTYSYFLRFGLFVVGLGFILD